VISNWNWRIGSEPFEGQLLLEQRLAGLGLLLYKEMGIEPWAVMEAVLTPEEFRGYLKGNIIKYAMRQGKKQDSDDTGKAKHYAQKLGEVNDGSNT
jgi:hypothetical protein